jgi:hypothetical protein
MRGHGDRELSDERILGSGDFVDRIISEADKKIKYQFPEKERKNSVEKYILDMCIRNGINIKEVQAGSRRRGVTELRAQIARSLVEDYGVPLAEIARQVGVSTSAVSKMMKHWQR